MANKRLEIIQLLRGIAALLVVLLHFHDDLRTDWPQFSEALSHGHFGVDIFFVISGFIIYISTESPVNRQSRSFLIRRFFRVVVPAWVAMVLLVFIKPPYLSSLILGIFFIPLENGNPPGYGYSFLIVAWTLTYELVFYLIFAGAMCSKLGRQHRGLLASVMLIVMIFLVQSLIGVYTLDADKVGLLPNNRNFPVQIISLLGNPLFVEFVIGIGFAWIYQRGLLSLLGQLRLALLLGNLILIFLTIKLQFHVGNGLTNGGLLAILIVICGLTIQSLIDTRGKPPYDGRIFVFFVFLGELSYSLYLIHPIIKSIAISPVVSKCCMQNQGLFTFFLLLACTFVAAYFFYVLVEIPSQSLGKKFTKPIRVLAVGA